MLPFSIATDAAPREVLTEAFVSGVVREVVRQVVPGAQDDASLSTDATSREDHFRVAVSTRSYGVYEGLERLGATIATKLYERGIPTLIYPEIAPLELSRARSQAEFVRERGWVRIVIPFEPVFLRQSDGSVVRESLGTARERILDDVRRVAPSARLAPTRVGPSKNEAHLHIDRDEYDERATMLPIHLLDEL